MKWNKGYGQHRGYKVFIAWAERHKKEKFRLMKCVMFQVVAK